MIVWNFQTRIDSITKPWSDGCFRTEHPLMYKFPAGTMNLSEGRPGMKLLITDIDGTLTDGNRVPKEVAEACGRLRTRGWRFMIATGRIWASARPFAEAIGSDLPSIVYDGARVLHGGGSVPIPCREWRIPNETADRVLELGWGSSLLIQAYGDEEVTCRPSDEVTQRFFRELHVPVMPNLNSPRLGFDPFRIIFYGDHGEARALGKRIRESLDFEVEATLAGEGFLDILPAGVSKGAAFRSYRNFAGLNPEAVVAAGDHLNDLDLLLEADLAVTFEDAPPEVRAAAHLIVPPASRMGFLELCRFLDKGESDSFFSNKVQQHRRGWPLFLGGQLPETKQEV
jgi:hydroxymethylpyrimidine pyrophosphatase-like HAD family hydrolase